MKNPPNLHQVQMFLSNISRVAARIFLLFHFCCIGLDIHSLQGKSLGFVLLCWHSCALMWNQSVMFHLRSRFCYSFRSSPLIIVTNQYQSKEPSNNSDKSPMQPRKKTSKFVRATLVLFVNLLFLLNGNVVLLHCLMKMSVAVATTNRNTANRVPSFADVSVDFLL